MKLLHLTSGVFLGLFLFLLPSCEDNHDQTGTIIVRITDAPFPIELISEASVTITKVQIRAADPLEEGSAATDAEGGSTGDTDGSPFITLYEGSYKTNLLELRNGVTAELASSEVAAGEYNLVRIYVENASITVKDQGTYMVKVPSGSQTGIKVFIKPGLKVAGGLTAEVLLDFNLEKSFVLQGDLETAAGIKGFSFKPVIRAVNNTVAGTITGVVTDVATEAPLSGVSVSVEVDGVEISAITDADGFYAMTGIPAGFYKVTAIREGYTTSTTNEIEVLEGNATIQNFALSVIPTF
jgi:hypothetical protein